MMMSSGIQSSFTSVISVTHFSQPNPTNQIPSLSPTSSTDTSHSTVHSVTTAIHSVSDSVTTPLLS